MADPLHWKGDGQGAYMSTDGRFLVVQVTVPGKKQPRLVWGLYGRVCLVVEASDAPPAPWCWGDEPLAIRPKKRDCQACAESSSYQVQIRHYQRAPKPAPTEDDAPLPGRCPECTVRFTPEPGHRYEEYCGRNCAEDALERVSRILGKGVTLRDQQGKPLRVGPARPNEPDFRPNQ